MIRSNYIHFFKYNVDIETRVNRNSTTSTFLFVWSLDESWDHSLIYLLFIYLLYNIYKAPI